MELIEVMGLVTTIVTLGMFMTGLPPCLEMYKSKSTKNIPFLMFAVSLLSCSQMLHYSLMLNNSTTMLLVNAVGTVMQAVYVVMYMIVVEQKGRPLVYLTLTAIYQASLYYYLYYVIGEQPHLSDTLGASGSYLTTFLVLLPVFEIIQNFKHKNADGMPMIMLLGGLMCGICWLIYGMMLGDPNVYRPNIPGIAINLTKITAVLIYRDNDKKKAE